MQDEELRKNFAKRLKDLLYEKRISQKEFAKMVGVSPSATNTWMLGINIPRTDKLDKICQVLGTTKTYLIEGETVVQRHITDDEAELLMEYRKLSEINKGRLLEQMKHMDKEKRESLESRLPLLDEKRALLVDVVAGMSNDEIKQLNNLLGIG